jgi:hypothetical protein
MNGKKYAGFSPFKTCAAAKQIPIRDTARLNMLLKKFSKRIPRGLKLTRNDNCKGA